MFVNKGMFDDETNAEQVTDAEERKTALNNLVVDESDLEPTSSQVCNYQIVIY
jgi:hypothetical protein